MSKMKKKNWAKVFQMNNLVKKCIASQTEFPSSFFWLIKGPRRERDAEHRL